MSRVVSRVLSSFVTLSLAFSLALPTTPVGALDSPQTVLPAPVTSLTAPSAVEQSKDSQSVVGAAEEIGLNRTANYTDSQLRTLWVSLRPTHSGAVYATVPSISVPHAPGELSPGFLADGLNTINFARFLAGVPHDVRLDSTRNLEGQYGAVLLAAGGFSHFPPKPSGMTQDFYDRGYASTSSSNIGAGYATAAEFQRGSLHDSDASNIDRVGHRRWLLNPSMAVTGIGHADAYYTTYAFDRSRPDVVSYSAIAYPSAGPFPIDLGFFDSRTPWSISLNPARYVWDSTGHTVTMRRVEDGRTWTFTAADTDKNGEYFRLDTGGYGIPNSFIFRPDPASATYRDGDEFDIELAGGIFSRDTRAPARITYRTRFTAIEPTIAGDDRYDTAVLTSVEAFPDGADTVVIATGENWPDALGGSALAGALDAPVLLTRSSALPQAVSVEIRRLKATRAIILGGTGAVSEAVETTLKTLIPNVERIAGSDRYETADAVARRVVQLKGDAYDGRAFVTTGGNFPDALAAAPLAAAKQWPLYLSHPTTGISRDTQSAMVGVTDVLVLGGTAAVSQPVEDYLKANYGNIKVRRLAGGDRFATAVAVANYGADRAGLGWGRIGIATGDNFPDALAGGVLQARQGSVMLLTGSLALSAPARDALAANKADIDWVTYFGGTSALSPAVHIGVARALR